jgi:regulator of nonsense transcripts 2
MRKKQVSNLDNRYTIMIENTYYYCNPPESKQIERNVSSPLHEYIKKILYKDLNKLCVEKVGFVFQKAVYIKSCIYKIYYVYNN